MSWRKMPDVNVPDVNTDDVKIVETSTNITTPSGSYNVHYLDGVPSKVNEPRDVSLLMLHGMRFCADTWRQLGTIKLFCALGYRVVAVDLPGYGKTGGNKLEQSHAATFLEEFIASARICNPVIVSPSMSGMFSLPYVLKRPSPSCVKGFVPVAPIDTGLYLADQYKSCTIPTLILYGQNDKVLGPVSTTNLSAMSIHEVTCLEGAGHACYLDKPDLWHKSLYNFILNVAL